MPYERLSPDTDVVRERLQVLYTLLSLKEEGSRPVIVTSITALTTPTIAPEAFAAAMVTLAQGGRFRWDRMASQWLRMGYELTSTVEQPGQFARRGGIVDCYPPQMEEPFRLELFGDEIENIRLFDPASQRSTRLVHAVTIPPARELLGPPWTAPPPELRLETCAPAVQAAYREDLRGLVEGQEVKTPWFYAPLFSRASVVDYLPPDALTVLDEPQELQWTFDEYQRQAQKLRDDLLSKSELPTDFPEPYHDFAWVLSRVKSGSRSLHLHRWGGEGEEDVGFAPTSGYAGRLPAVIADLRQAMRAGERVVLVSHQSQRLADLLDEQGIIAQPRRTWTVLPLLRRSPWCTALFRVGGCSRCLPRLRASPSRRQRSLPSARRRAAFGDRQKDRPLGFHQSAHPIDWPTRSSFSSHSGRKAGSRAP